MRNKTEVMVTSRGEIQCDTELNRTNLNRLRSAQSGGMIAAEGECKMYDNKG